MGSCGGSSCLAKLELLCLWSLHLVLLGLYSSLARIEGLVYMIYSGLGWSGVIITDSGIILTHKGTVGGAQVQGLEEDDQQQTLVFQPMHL